MVDLVENLFTVVERVSVAKLSKMRTTRSACLVLCLVPPVHSDIIVDTLSVGDV